MSDYLAWYGILGAMWWHVGLTAGVLAGVCLGLGISLLRAVLSGGSGQLREIS